MAQSLTPILLFGIAFLIFAFQLWSGSAIAGWAGDFALVHRRKTPGPYWFVLSVQAIALFVIPVLIWLFG